MAKYTIEDTTLTNIAEAIREKGGTTETLTPVQMPEAISAIQAGSGETKNEGLLVSQGAGFAPSVITASASGGRRYYSAGSYNTMYYWYRSDNANLYWQVCAWNPGKFTEGHKYRVSTWIWHDGASDEVINFWQTNIFFNGSVNVPNPLTNKGITSTPQLLSYTFDYVPNSSYGAVFYIYPEASQSQIRLTPVVVEDLTSPATNYPPIAL